MISYVSALLIASVFGLSHAQNTPPVLVATPRTLQLPLDTKVGTVVARVKATDHDGDEVTFTIEPNSQVLQGRFPIKDGSPYFKITKKQGEGLITLSASLQDAFKFGDQLSFSVTGEDGVSGITTRTEIPVFIEKPFHTDLELESEQEASSSTTLPTSTPSKSSTGSTSTTNAVPATGSTGGIVPPENGTLVGVDGKQSEQELLEESSRKYILTLVPIFVVCPALAVGAFFFRKKLMKLGQKCCDCNQNQEKDPAKIESAEGEFFKMQPDQRKVSTNSYGFSLKTGEINAIPVLEDEDQWEFPRYQLKILGMLGEGCFGQVWKCEAENIDGHKGTKIVAVKTLKDSASEKEKKDLLHELSVMKMLEPHPNVVKLLGCCTDKDPIFVIIEYVAGGTLQDFLRKSRSEHNYKNLHGESQSLSARDLTSFAFQIAKGMAFLSSKKVIHRDLAARNVLITQEDGSGKYCNRCCKIADFGFARDIMANNIYERKSEGRLPIRWMAPESLYDNCYTTKSDVWSFGVLLWEIVTLGSTPYPGLSASEVMKRVRDGNRLEKPEHCKREIYNIMYYCWDKNPESRPTFSELVQEFESLLVKETDYIDLNMFPEHAYYNEISLSGEKV